MHDPEVPRLPAWHLEAADGDVGALLDMLLQHAFVVHLVDVISGEKHDEFGIVRLDDVDVLINGVSRSEVPVRLRDALARRQDIETLVALRTKEVPTHLQMPDEAVSLVL